MDDVQALSVDGLVCCSCASKVEQAVGTLFDGALTSAPSAVVWEEGLAIVASPPAAPMAVDSLVYPPPTDLMRTLDSAAPLEYDSTSGELYRSSAPSLLRTAATISGIGFTSRPHPNASRSTVIFSFSASGGAAVSLGAAMNIVPSDIVVTAFLSNGQVDASIGALTQDQFRDSVLAATPRSHSRCSVSFEVERCRAVLKDGRVVESDREADVRRSADESLVGLEVVLSAPKVLREGSSSPSIRGGVVVAAKVASEAPAAAGADGGGIISPATADMLSASTQWPRDAAEAVTAAPIGAAVVATAAGALRAEVISRLRSNVGDAVEVYGGGVCELAWATGPHASAASAAALAGRIRNCVGVFGGGGEVNNTPWGAKIVDCAVRPRPGRVAVTVSGCAAGIAATVVAIERFLAAAGVEVTGRTFKTEGSSDTDVSAAATGDVVGVGAAVVKMRVAHGMVAGAGRVDDALFGEASAGGAHVDVLPLLPLWPRGWQLPPLFTTAETTKNPPVVKPIATSPTPLPVRVGSAALRGLPVPRDVLQQFEDAVANATAFLGPGSSRGVGGSFTPPSQSTYVPGKGAVAGGIGKGGAGEQAGGGDAGGADDDTVTVWTFLVGGMSCASCSAKIERRLMEVPGVTAAAVNFATQTAKVQVAAPVGTGGADSTQVSLGRVSEAELISTIEGLGFTASPLDASAGAGRDALKTALLHRDVLRMFAMRLAVSVFFGWPLLVQMALMYAHTSLPYTHVRVVGIATWWGVVQWLLATPVVAFGAWPFLRGAVAALRNYAANMDVLVALGVVSTYVASVLYLVLDATTSVPPPPAPAPRPTHLYFETASTLTIFMLVGKCVEHHTKGRMSSAMVALLDLQPATATVVTVTERDRITGEPTAFSQRTVAVDLVAVGDEVAVNAGGKVPVDGTVTAGQAAVDTSALTGESVPVAVGVGDDVLGGSIVSDGHLRVKATKVGAESAVAQIVRLVQDAQQSKPAIQRLADIIAMYFVPVVLVLALGTLGIWWWAGAHEWFPPQWREVSAVADAGEGGHMRAAYDDQGVTAFGESFAEGAVMVTPTPTPPVWRMFESAVGHAMLSPFLFALRFTVAVLMVACPCALGLATPTAVMVATSVGARMGVLIKGGAPLEDCGRVSVVLFDKTGTLTESAVSVVGAALLLPEADDALPVAAPQHDILRKYFSPSAVGAPSSIAQTVTEARAQPADVLTQRFALRAIAAAEATSSHPLAAALVKYIAGALHPSSGYAATDVGTMNDDADSRSVMTASAVGGSEVNVAVVDEGVVAEFTSALPPPVVVQSHAGRGLVVRFHSHTLASSGDDSDRPSGDLAASPSASPASADGDLEVVVGSATFVLATVVRGGGAVGERRGSVTRDAVKAATDAALSGDASRQRRESLAQDPTVAATSLLVSTLSQQGCTAVAAAVNGRLVAVFGVAASLRPEAEATVRSLRKLGVTSCMVTGDNEMAARAIAARAGIAPECVFAGVLPDEKLKVVERMQLLVRDPTSRSERSGSHHEYPGNSNAGRSSSTVNDAFSYDDDEFRGRRRVTFSGVVDLEGVGEVLEDDALRTLRRRPKRLIRAFFDKLRSLGADSRERGRGWTRVPTPTSDLDDRQEGASSGLLEEPSIPTRQVLAEHPLFSVSSLGQAREVTREPLKRGLVAMVGDGINDGPALAAADCGIAIGSGSEIALECANLVLTRNSLFDVVTALVLSRTTVRRIRLNFVWAFGYNIVMLPVAAGVFYPFVRWSLEPELAGIAMVISSISVLISSSALLLFKAPSPT